MSSASPVRGMRDFLPSEKSQRELVLDSIRKTYQDHGFVEIETPYLEQLDRLTSNQGGDNEKMLFKVQKRGLSSSDLANAVSPDELSDVGLRYDLTLPLARYYANCRGKIPETFRCMQIGPVWRAERPQKGRYRQFTQCDIDVIGEESSLAEVELIVVTIKALDRLGLAGITLKINDRRLLSALLQFVQAPVECWSHCLVIVDKLDKVGVSGVREELTDLLSPVVVDRLTACLQEFQTAGFDITAFERLVAGANVPETTANLRRILQGVDEGLGSMNVALKFDGSLVRGMGYYTGPIFELWHPSFTGAIAGGGRYDGMIGRFLGKSVPACGFSIGFERMVELAKVRTDAEQKKLALMYGPDVAWGRVVAVQGSLVRDGYSVRLIPKPRRLGLVLNTLAAEGFSRWLDLTAPENSENDIRSLVDPRNVDLH